MNVKEKPFVPRVTQLDAVELDKEIIEVLKAQVTNITKFGNASLLAKWEPEINAVLRLIIWKFSVNQLYSTFGQQLLSVKYGGPFNKNKAYMFALLTIGPRYIDERSREIAQVFGNSRASDLVSQCFNQIRLVVDFSSIMNLFVFLMQGKYPTLVDRLLNMCPVSVATRMRTPGYSYMTREVLWHGFNELLGVTLPLVNFYYLRRKFLNLLSWRAKSKGQAVIFTSSTKCALCRASPILPHEIGCCHVFCFYCIQANYIADKEFQCPLCGFSPENSDCIIPLQV